jgi:hypothetical protein
LLIFFELKFLSCFKAEGLATLNSQNLWRHGPSTEGLRDALLTVWTIVQMNPHEKRMLAPTINAMNIDFVCRHMLPLAATVLSRWTLRLAMGCLDCQPGNPPAAFLKITKGNLTNPLGREIY